MQERGDARGAIAGVVADNGEVARALGDQRVDQFVRLACAAEATNQDDGAILDALYGCLKVGNDFGNHVAIVLTALVRERLTSGAAS